MKTRDELLLSVKGAVASQREWDINELLYELEMEYAIQHINTHGLPFNGTTYELYREVEMDGFFFKETIGHLKTLTEVYGGQKYLFVFEPGISGGSALNDYNSPNYVMKKTFNKLGKAVSVSTY